MTSSLVGSEMCIRDRTKQPKEAQRLLVGCWKLLCKTVMSGMCMDALPEPVSYTHLTLPTICSV
eukprot:8367654-Prorocentrum_lima.AAC.1